MKLKHQNTIRLIGYFLYMVFIICVLIKGSDLERNIKLFVGQTYSLFPYLFFFQQSFFFVIGILLAMPEFIITLKKHGNWHFDWVKFIAIGVPTLFVAISPVLYFSPLGNYIPQIRAVMSYSAYPQIVCAIIFGYLLFSVFDKQR